MALKQLLVLGRILVLAQVLVLGPKLATSQITKPGCLGRCGSVNIPYPFGTSSHGDGCYLDDSFLVTCNDSYYDPPLLFFQNIESNVAIINISLPDGELQVKRPISRDCYNKLGNGTTTNKDRFIFTYTSSRYSLSSRRNKFTVIGCDTLGLITSRSRTNYSTGCVTECNQIKEVTNGSCNGLGCCQMPIPEGVVDYLASASSFDNPTKVHGFNPCSYSFEYNFN